VVERFEDLLAWQKGRVLCREIYRVTKEGSFARDFALRDQIRKAAISIPSNIAEGFERFRLSEFHQFLSIAKASAAEVRTQIYLASDIGYIDDETRSTLLIGATKTSQVIAALRTSVEHRMEATKHEGRSTKDAAQSTKAEV
jgi:four helix bundle protein